MRPRPMSLRRTLSALLTALLVLLALTTSSLAQDVDFARDVRPIFAEHCAQCHGPDEANRMADLHLDIPETFRAEADGYSVIVPGEPESSELYRRITATATGSVTATGAPPGDIMYAIAATPHPIANTSNAQGNIVGLVGCPGAMELG